MVHTPGGWRGEYVLISAVCIYDDGGEHSRQDDPVESGEQLQPATLSSLPGYSSPLRNLAYFPMSTCSHRLIDCITMHVGDFLHPRRPCLDTSIHTFHKLPGRNFRPLMSPQALQVLIRRTFFTLGVEDFLFHSNFKRYQYHSRNWLSSLPGSVRAMKRQAMNAARIDIIRTPRTR